MIKMFSKGHTLWLMPPGDNYKRFFDLIKKLAHQYDAPVFEPHITLLGDVSQTQEEAIKLSQILVKGVRPFPLTLKQVDYEEYHFRTLFVKAEITEPLLKLHEKAKQLFNMQHTPPYMAHLSILYGHYPVEVKEEIIKTIGRDQNAQFEVKSVFLLEGGEVEDWKIIQEFPFLGIS